MHAMIMISSFAAAKQFNLSIRVNRNYDLFSRWEQEGWTPPSMKRPSLPARVVDAKKSMNFPSLLKSTGCESELELKELLMKKPLLRGKGLKSIKFFKGYRKLSKFMHQPSHISAAAIRLLLFRLYHARHFFYRLSLIGKRPIAFIA